MPTQSEPMSFSAVAVSVAAPWQRPLQRPNAAPWQRLWQQLAALSRISSALWHEQLSLASRISLPHQLSFPSSPLRISSLRISSPHQLSPHRLSLHQSALSAQLSLAALPALSATVLSHPQRTLHAMSLFTARRSMIHECCSCSVCSVVTCSWRIDNVIDSMFGERTRESSGTQQQANTIAAKTIDLQSSRARSAYFQTLAMSLLLHPICAGCNVK